MAYRAKTLSGAQRRVRELESQVRQCREILDRWAKERQLLARLAAKGPAFDNPLIAFEAEEIRDRILKQMGMNPDGTFREKARA